MVIILNTEETKLKTFVKGVVAGAIIYGLISFLVPNIKGKLEQRVEFSARGDRITGWSDPQTQTIYLGIDFKGDNFFETYSIQNPFDKNGFKLEYYSGEKKQNAN